MDFLLFEKLQGFINILQAVDTHAAFGGLWLWGAEKKRSTPMWSQHTWGGTDGRNLKREKQVKAEGEVHHTGKKKEKMKHMISPSSWLVEQGGGHAVGAWVRVKEGRGCLHVILTSCSPESTSRRRISMRPSRRSVYKSPMRQVTLPKWEFTHLVKVFFCTASRSSATRREREGLKSHYTDYNQLHILRCNWVQQHYCQGYKYFQGISFLY